MAHTQFGIINAPNEELNRSPAAQVIGAQAAKSELFLTHFEHRHHIEPPSYWLPQDRPDLDGSLRWQRGALKEHKFLHFRYDQPLGSFHPGHRAKWTSHELCHGLVGFAWDPRMTPLSHVLVARLAELLPVALWYFFDEIQLRRCPLHYLQGALFQERCVYCERLATEGPRLLEPEDELWLNRGVEFLQGELAAVARSRRFKRPLPHRFATLDLNSDAMAFTAHNLARLEDPVFRRFIEQFHGPHTGMWSHIDDLEGRLWGVSESLREGLHAPTLTAGRQHWVAQDVAWRLLTVSAQCEDLEAVEALEQMVDYLAEQPQDILGVARLYSSLYEEFFIPEPEQVFALGYEIGGGYGSDVAQLAKGVASACPTLERALGAEGLIEQVRAFASWDLQRPQRLPIARRFAMFLRETGGGPLCDLATYEAAINDPEPPDPWAACLAWEAPSGELVRRAQGVEVISVGVDIDQLVEALSTDNEEMEVTERPHHLIIVNKPGGMREVSELSARAAKSLELLNDGPMERALLGIEPEELRQLSEMGALTPCAWAELREPELRSSAEPSDSASLDDEAPLPDALWLEGRDPEEQVEGRASEPPASQGELAYEPSPQPSNPPPYSSVDLDAYSSVDLELDHERPPLNSFEAALRSAIAGQSNPPAPAELDLREYEDLFVFKDIDKEGSDDED